MTHCLTIELGAPVASADPYIHLDSFLSFAAAVESIGYDGLDELSDSDSPLYFEDEMPLEQYRVDDEWVWASSAASIAVPDDEQQASAPERWSTTRWRKRFDHDPEHQIKKTHVNVSSGEFKGYNAALPYTAADELVFFFEGDADRVVEMIETHVPAIGKKRSQGFGRIRNVSVQDVGDAIESAVYHNGRVLRSFPVQFFGKVPVNTPFQRRTVRPPYWHADNQCMAVPPFVDVDREDLHEELDLRTPATV